MLRIDLLMMIKGRKVTSITDTSFWYMISYIRVLLDECLPGCLKHISTLHRSSYNSLVDLICGSLSIMLKHRLRHVRNGNMRLLRRFIRVNWSLSFFFYRSHCVRGYGPRSRHSIGVFGEWSHCIPYNPTLYTLMNLIFEELIRSLRSLSITNKPRFNPRILSAWKLLIVICKCEILLLNKIVSGNSGRRILVFKISPLVLSLIPICLSIVRLLNANISWWVVIILLKVVSYPLCFSFGVNWFEVFKLAHIKFMSCSHLFLMHL